MTGSVVDMAPFWWLVAVPAALAVLLAAGYVLAAWKWPALRTPVFAFRMWWRKNRHLTLGGRPCPAELSSGWCERCGWIDPRVWEGKR